MTGRKCRRCRVVRTSPAASPITALEGSTGALQEAEAHHPLRPPLGSGRACMDHALCLWQGHARVPRTAPAVCLLVNLFSII